MNAPKKFLFETSFEPDEQKGAQRPAKKEPEPTYLEEDLTKARDDGFAAGKEAGQKAAEESIEGDIAQALERMTQQLGELGNAQSELIENRVRETIETAVAVIRKLFPSLTDTHGMTEIEAIISECLTHLRTEPRVVIRVADSLLDAVNQRTKELAAKAGFDGKLVLIAQNDLPAGDVRVEWADGGAERDSGLLWREIDNVLSRVIGITPPDAADATPDDSATVALTQDSDRPRAVSQ